MPTHKADDKNKGATFLSQIIVLLALFSTLGFCTSVVAVLNNQTIIIAADRKQLNTETGEIGPCCKIGRGRNFYWAVAGLIRDFDTKFNIKANINHVAETSATPSAKIARLDKWIPDLVETEANEMRRKGQRNFQQYTEGLVFLEVFYAGFEGNHAIAVVREYGIKLTSGTISVVRSYHVDCPGEECAEPQYFILGDRDSINPYLPSHPNMFQKQSIDVSIAGARGLVEMEIRSNPSAVGGPVDVARIDRNGLRWIEHKIKCPSRDY